MDRTELVRRAWSCPQGKELEEVERELLPLMEVRQYGLSLNWRSFPPRNLARVLGQIGFGEEETERYLLLVKDGPSCVAEDEVDLGALDYHPWFGVKTTEET